MFYFSPVSSYQVRGPQYWKYKGELIEDRRERHDKLTDEACAVMATGPESPDAKQEKQPSSKNTEARDKVIDASNRNQAQAEISRLESRVKQLETKLENLHRALEIILADATTTWKAWFDDGDRA